MQLPRTPLFMVWYVAVLVAALYLLVRLFGAEYGRADYALMVFVHGSLVIQYALGWWRSREARRGEAARALVGVRLLVPSRVSRAGRGIQPGAGAHGEIPRLRSRGDLRSR